MEAYNNLKKEIKDLLEANKNLILHGAPGTGKTYLAKEIAKELTGCRDNDNCERIGFVQFHPSYDYTDFVEGLRPVKKKNGEIGFELIDGIFMKFCNNAKKNKDKDSKYVFIIDEINRADISKVFGELFFSIEPGYRGEKGKVLTQYSNLRKEKNKELFVPENVYINLTQYSNLRKEKNKEFFVPENVYIIGTMNDIDRSVESFDFAIRRRFAWIEIKAKDTMNSILSDLDENIKQEAIKKLTALNEKIAKTNGLNSSYHIGAAYFLKLKDYYQEGNTQEAFAQLWQYHLEPLLKEYLRGLPDVDKKIEELKNAYDNPEQNNNSQQEQTESE